MELRVLRYFLAVAREESISGAAESLNVTQPTLSRQIAELEEELGKKLFTRLRGSRKTILTPEGLFLRKRALEILDLTEKTKADFSDKDEIISGEVSIGGGEAYVMRIIAQTVNKLSKNYPFIRYRLFSGNAEEVVEQLDKGLLDFGVLIGHVNVGKYDCLQFPTADIVGLLMRKDSELAALPSIKPDNLKNIPLLTPRNTLIADELSGWLGDDFNKLNIIATWNLIYNAALIVDEGAGYAICLNKFINIIGNMNLCFRPLEPRLEAQMYFVWKKNQVFSKAAEKFMRQMHTDITASNS